METEDRIRRSERFLNNLRNQLLPGGLQTPNKAWQESQAKGLSDPETIIANFIKFIENAKSTYEREITTPIGDYLFRQVEFYIEDLIIAQKEKRQAEFIKEYSDKGTRDWLLILMDPRHYLIFPGCSQKYKEMLTSLEAAREPEQYFAKYFFAGKGIEIAWENAFLKACEAKNVSELSRLLELGEKYIGQNRVSKILTHLFKINLLVIPNSHSIAENDILLQTKESLNFLKINLPSSPRESSPFATEAYASLPHQLKKIVSDHHYIITKKQADSEDSRAFMTQLNEIKNLVLRTRKLFTLPEVESLLSKENSALSEIEAAVNDLDNFYMRYGIPDEQDKITIAHRINKITGALSGEYQCEYSNDLIAAFGCRLEQYTSLPRLKNPRKLAQGEKFDERIKGISKMSNNEEVFHNFKAGYDAYEELVKILEKFTAEFYASHLANLELISLRSHLAECWHESLRSDLVSPVESWKIIIELLNYAEQHLAQNESEIVKICQDLDENGNFFSCDYNKGIKSIKKSVCDNILECGFSLPDSPLPWADEFAQHTPGNNETSREFASQRGGIPEGFPQLHGAMFSTRMPGNLSGDSFKNPFGKKADGQSATSEAGWEQETRERQRDGKKFIQTVLNHLTGGSCDAPPERDPSEISFKKP